MTTLPIPVRADKDFGIDPVLVCDPSSSTIGNFSNEDEYFLLRAFRTFSGAAASLEHAYGVLRSEVASLRSELEKSNSGLAASLEENRQMGAYLDRILQTLPCGLIVISSGGHITKANLEAIRLLRTSLLSQK
jgi:PAS domain-containing protein